MRPCGRKLTSGLLIEVSVKNCAGAATLREKIGALSSHPARTSLVKLGVGVKRQTAT
jgi:hypothetical protein